MSRQRSGQLNINMTIKNKNCKTFITSLQSNNTQMKNNRGILGLNRREILVNGRLRYSNTGAILTSKRRSLYSDRLKLKSMESSLPKVS